MCMCVYWVQILSNNEQFDYNNPAKDSNGIKIPLIYIKLYFVLLPFSFTIKLNVNHVMP